MTRLCAFLVASGILAIPAPTFADEAELQPMLVPAFTILPRHDHFNRGLGTAILGRWGWLDAVAFEGFVHCDRFASLRDPSFSDDNTNGSLYYDVTRCLIAPGVALRFGARLVTSLSLDVGYRFEVQSNRDFVSPAKVLIGKEPQRTLHALVGRAGASIEYRIWEWLSAGGQLAITSPLLGTQHGADYTFGLLVSVYFYP